MLRLGIYRVNGLSSGCIISDYILKDISTMKTRTLRIVLKLCLKLRRSLQMPSLLRNISWLSLATIVNDPTVEHRRKLRWPVKFWYYCASVKRNRQFEPYLPLTLCRRSHSRRVMIVLSRHKSNRVTVCINVHSQRNMGWCRSAERVRCEKKNCVKIKGSVLIN